MTTDSELLRRFAREADQTAFAELMHRHLNLIYAAALRQLDGDSHQAEDVAQEVFLRLARKASSLVQHPCLIGWLYTATRLVCVQRSRSHQRRAKRETEAYIMTTSSNIEPPWEKVRPFVDDAMHGLSEKERRVLLLRFFSNQDYRSIGAQLGLTDNAAQKLAARALERLNTALSLRGFTSTSAALALMLESPGMAAPATLSASILAGIVTNAAPVAAAGSLSTMIISKFALGAVTAAIGFGGGLLYHSSSFVSPPVAPAVTVQPTATDITELKRQLVETQKRVVSVEEDNTRLLEAVGRFKSAAPTTVVAPMRSAPAPPSTPAVASNDYIIMPSDTARKIAGALGISELELQSLNPEVNWARLKVGQKIQVPLPPEE